MSVRIVEVGPRDGLQNIRESVPVETKLEFIQRLQRTGLQTIELTSAVSPKAIPQLADCREILSAPFVKTWLQSSPSLRLQVLVPNIKGFNLARKHGIKEVGVFVSATEGFSRANINCSVEEGLQRAREVSIEARSHGVAVRGYVSCIFADPYDGPTSLPAVYHAVKSLFDMGCYEVSLGDTLGVGMTADVSRLIEYLAQKGIELDKLAGHFHDTYGQALANIWEAYRHGLRVFDSSVGGLGGCPFAPGATGNVATEDVVYLFEKAGITTGVNLQRLAETGSWISERLKKPNSSRAGAALSIKQDARKTKNFPAKAQTKISWSTIREEDNLLVQRSGVNLKLVLNRPQNGNALTLAMISHLVNAITRANHDESISRIILTANGKFFCTGMDLGKGNTIIEQSGSTGNAMLDGLTQLFDTIDSSPKVTIGVINGPAFGGGVGLAFACDLRLCLKSATFTLSEVKLGICPAVISKYVIREWGIPFSRSAMLTARTITSQELKSHHFVHDVAENSSELESSLNRLLDHLRYSSPTGSTMSKELIRLSWSDSGKPKQKEEIAKIFREMTKPGTQGAYGVGEFQRRKKVDWDSYISRVSKPRL